MINNVVLMGRLCAAPELMKTSSGISVLRLSIAVDRRTKKDEEKVTDFITIKAWRERAEFISKYFDKGDMIAVTGELQMLKYTDKNGVNKTFAEVLVNNISFCGSKAQKDESSASTPQRTKFEDPMPDDDDLPF
jgi:single-strand DNA-binding protein